MALYTFEPLYQSRLWGGRALEKLFGRTLPHPGKIAEAWDLVDRPENQSICRETSQTLHELWVSAERSKIFGTQAPLAERFPILIKLIDAKEKLSLQVHPPARVATQLAGEPKNEMWYFLHTQPGAEIYVGFKKTPARSFFRKIASFFGLNPARKRQDFEKAIASGTAQECIHALQTAPYRAIYIPSGRIHGIGAGNVLLEVEQNSDTTFRVYDYNRLDDQGHPRELHVKQAMECIDFDDVEPQWIQPHGEKLLSTEFFEVSHYFFEAKQSRCFSSDPTSFQYFFVAQGAFDFAGRAWHQGSAVLVSADHGVLELTCRSNEGVLVRVKFP